MDIRVQYLKFSSNFLGAKFKLNELVDDSNGKTGWKHD